MDSREWEKPWIITRFGLEVNARLLGPVELPLPRRGGASNARPRPPNVPPTPPVHAFVSLDFLNPVIGDDIAAVDRMLRESLNSDVVLIREVAN